MNRKQNKELRQLQSTRQLMGVDQLTCHGLRTARWELVFFLIQPDNLSIMSAENIRGRVFALTNLLRGTDELCLLAQDSRESFLANKNWYQIRLSQEQNPAIRELLQLDMDHLDEIQATTASAREFALIYRMEPQATEDPDGQLRRMEKRIRDHGFRVRLAAAQDIKRLLAIYYQQDVTTERFDSFDGERWVKQSG